MNFNFYEQYRELSNIELLKITRVSGQYTPDAVAVANEILSEREISAEETAFIDAYINDVALTEETKAAKKEQDRQLTREFIISFIFPNKIERIQLFINGIIFLLGLWLVWSVYTSFDVEGQFYKCVDCLWTRPGLSIMMWWLYYLATVNTLFFRRRIGWMLLYGGGMYIIVKAVLFELYRIIAFFEFYQGPILPTLYSCALSVAAMAFMSRKQVMGIFKVTDNVKKQTLAGAAFLALLSICYFIFLY